MYYAGIVLACMAGLFLLGFSIGAGVWLSYGYWQARVDRKTAELYCQKQNQP